MMSRCNGSIQRVRLSVTAGSLRLGLALISLVALVLGGSASSHWD
jgi:hypothetical protein